MPGRLKRDKMVEKHKEESEELKRGRQREARREQRLRRDRQRERETERKKEAALLLFQTMTGNVAKDSHIVQQDTVQYIGFITDTVCSQMN